MATPSWIVHKFGGTSVANAERYRNVATIMRKEPGPNKAIVVSAMAKVTDSLIELMDLARRRDPSYRTKLEDLTRRHVDTARELLDGAHANLVSVFEADGRDIADILRAVWLGRGYSESTLELVAGYGELWSAQLLHAYLLQSGVRAAWLDARKVLTVSPAEIGPMIDWGLSKAQCGAWVRDNSAEWLVITGYVASTHGGVPTTLKRNGSDFSASIFGSLLDAESIVIWTDVDGVLSADPRRVPEAVVLERMSYDEAMELAYFGAKVLHPRTMAPAIDQAIPIWIRNTFRPDYPGTKIHTRGDGASGDRAVKGFSTADKIALVNVEGTGMIGVPGIAQRVFGALRQVGVSVVMISQASSEHSICFAVPEAQGETAKRTVEQAFASEVQQGEVQRVEIVPGCSILAAVGDTMAQTPGIAAKFFGALGKAGVNIRAIAQGSSERNISAVIDRSASTRALRAVHAGFYLSNQALSVGVIGPGLVGGALLRQLEAQAPVLRDQFKIDLRIRGIMNTDRMVLHDAGLPLAKWREMLRDSTTVSQLDAFASHIQSEHLPHSVIIDCTASEAIAERYLGWLSRGIHVVTPNKRAGAGPAERYRELRRLGRERRRHFLYEATVGAGLPVITTLRDLIQTGDRVAQIEGVLSGTLSYVFNTFDGSRSFSDVVREAKRLGYTEPDPRDDLSGMDVARKLVILAREAERVLELSSVAVQSLVPEQGRAAATPEEFLDRLAASDGEMERVRSQASARGEVLRYVGVLDERGEARVELKSYSASHPFARIGASDNIIAFTTQRYREQPLIVQGPGAGPEVTAGGVFADLLRLANSVA